MPKSTPKSQKTSGGLNNLHDYDWKENGGIRTNILYLVSHNL